MSSLPQTRDGLESVGYKYSGEGRCRACGVPILWFRTPSLKNLSFHIEKGSEDDDHRILIPHFASCEYAKDFRKAKKKK